MGRINRNRFIIISLSMLLMSAYVLFGKLSYAYAADPQYRDNISDTASSGNIIIGVLGMDVTPGEETLLAKINAARKSACENGEPDPRDTSRKLQPSDYVPLEIGVNCKKSARIRACEASLKMAHIRPNGEVCLTVLEAFNPTNSLRAENLVWDSTGETCVDLWLGEREAYLGNETGQTGHYATLINPNYKYTGMASFNPDNDSSKYNWTCTAGQYAASDVPQTGFDGAQSENVVQKIEVPISAVKELIIPGNSWMAVGDETTLVLNTGVQFNTEVSYNSATLCPVYDAVAWTTSDAGVLSIDSSGHIKAESNGKATVTATVGTGTGSASVSKEFIVTGSSVTVSGIEEPAVITVESNKKPELPVVVKATLSNGEKADISVEWNSYDDSKLLTYFESKDFQITGKAGTYDVIQKVHVNAASMTGTYTTPSTITTDSGVEPTYPKACVGMSNGYMFTDIEVEWDAESLNYYKKTEGGTFTMKGKTKYEFPTDSGKKRFDVTMTLIVKAANTKPEPPHTEESNPGSQGGETSGNPGDNKDSSAEKNTVPENPQTAQPDSGTSTSSGTGGESNNTADVSVGEEKHVGNVDYTVTSVDASADKNNAGEVSFKSVDKSAKTVVIPAKITIAGKKYRVTSIDKNVFKKNKKLVKITIGKNITNIGENAFYKCTKLRKIIIKGTSIKRIGKNAFKGVSKKSTAKVPGKVKSRYKKLLKKAKFKGKLR